MIKYTEYGWDSTGGWRMMPRTEINQMCVNEIF